MADHVVSLTAKQEAAAQALVAPMNQTVDTWLRDYVLAPIKNKIAEQKALNTAAVADAYDAATKTVQDRVKADLGLV